MRLTIGVLMALALPLASLSQEKEERRFGVRYNPELYSQESPKKTLAALMRALQRDRYDYLVAQLLEPGYVDEQLKISYPQFEKQAREQVQKEELEKKGFPKEEVRARIAALANTANFEYLARRIRTKLENDPESVKELKQMSSDGEVMESGEAAVCKLKDLKDRALYFKKVRDRWYLENKLSDEKE